MDSVENNIFIVSLFLIFFFISFFLLQYNMGRTMRKRVIEHMRTAKAQINLRIRIVGSGPCLSADRIVW